MTEEGTLSDRIHAALDALLRALELRPVDSPDGAGDRFRVEPEPVRFTWVFGGQTLAQALVAAARTVEGKPPHSLHAAFVEAGRPDEPIDLTVDRVRDGRSFATRHVRVHQGERTLLDAIISFHANVDEPDVADPPPSVPGPDATPALQDWALALPPEAYAHSRTWVEQPPPVELRIGEAPTFLEGDTGRGGTRSHWMRLPRPVGDDPLLHTALLAYASDYLLLDMVFRSHPGRSTPGAYTGFSLDHAVWFHRPVRFDRWHLHTQETLSVNGHRGLVRGAIHDDAGRLVATCVQEGLARPTAGTVSAP